MIERLIKLWVTSCICIGPLLITTNGFGLDWGVVKSRWKHLEEENDYGIVIPYETDESGSYVSHDLTRHRRRRSTDQITQDSLSVFFHLNSTDTKSSTRLQLKPRHDLLHKEFKVHRRKTRLKDGKAVRTTIVETFDPSCLYQGTILNHMESTVALSICDGMMGLLQTSNSIYLIEPLPADLLQNLSIPQGHNPHIMYKHKTQDRQKGEPQCGSTELATKQLDETFKYADKKPHRSTRRRRDVRFQDTNYRKRNKGSRKSMETIVVIDSKMYKQHGAQNVTTYALTILNMVSSLFHDNTIGTKINITLVSLIMFEGDEPGLEVGHQADHTLTNFCQWQSSLEGVHHDHAILLTGVDICSYQDSPCETLGFAPIHGMCKQYRSCSINEDTGLGTAFTIAHEAGHNFGMFHDGEGNHCTDLAGSIMAPTLLGENGRFKWSACSRKYLNKFLRSSQAWCLEDEPRKVSLLRFPDKLPGELYDADIQCKWQFGRRARLCSFAFAKDLCTSLWCYIGGVNCETKFLPAAEGTSCGTGKWCRKGVCVRYGHEGPDPVDGGWSRFNQWTTCTRTCGAGVMYKERFCNTPRPQYGGKVCEGDGRVYKVCNTRDCPSPARSFREVQCAAYNYKPFRGWRYTWVPYSGTPDERESCKLYCRAKGYNFYFALSEKVVDGTECIGRPGKICVEGTCYDVGCDNMVDSPVEMDHCGVCGGDNSTCVMINGNFSHYLKPNAYHEILTLPRGSRSIIVREAGINPSYLALRNQHGIYYLTGNWRVSWPGIYKIAGTNFQYKRPYNGPEKISSDGPTNEDLVVEILTQGRAPTIMYQYTMPRAIDDYNTVVMPNYTWTVSTSDCSASCATGNKVITAKCFKDLHEEVNESYCSSNSKPQTGLIPCNTKACPPRWSALEWFTCSRTCGGGIQRRKVYCVQRFDITNERRVRSRLCLHLPRPHRRRSCNEQECPPEWHTGAWSQCSATCGNGTHQRLVNCRSRYRFDQQSLADNMCAEDKPSNIKQCHLEECQDTFKWFLSSWTVCSETCGKGVSVRKLRCSGQDNDGQYSEVSKEFCKNKTAPSVTFSQECQLRPCPKSSPRWFVSPWTECSVSCGKGYQLRKVKCMDDATGLTSDRCSKSEIPYAKKPCGKTCSPSHKRHLCTDTYQWCTLVKHHKLCNHKFYGKKCCHSCWRA